jgi:antitoxin HicB
MRYPAIMAWSDTDQTYLVEFPDLKGCHTMGETLAEAVANAVEAASLWLGVAHDEGMPLPAPSPLSGPGVHVVTIAPDVAIPIMIKRLREAAGLSQSQVAAKLGIRPQSYQRWERTDANITIRNLDRLAKALGKTLHVELLSA